MKTNQILDLTSQHSEVKNKSDVIKILTTLAQDFKISPYAIFKDFFKIFFKSKRKFTLEEYINFNLWNRDFLKNAKKEAFICEQDRKTYVCNMLATDDAITWGVTFNKKAFYLYGTQLKLPVIPVVKIVPPFIEGQTSYLENPLADLREFLLEPKNYPLFGKPSVSNQSLGSCALKTVSDETIHLMNGQTVSVDAFLKVILDNYGKYGYIFQNLMENHSCLVPVIGKTLATIRIMTLFTKTGPKVFRAVWKIPGPNNFADNFWRPGNLLANIDIASGAITHVISGIGADLQEYTCHPETKVNLIGYKIPEWDRIQETVLKGACIFNTIRILGWDVALTENGPIIVETNHSPDFMLVQLGNRQGFLEGFLAEEFREIFKTYHNKFS